jgi:uroporphyrinogen decarboxylase
VTGYDIVKGNINFTSPERIGLRFDRIAGVSDVYRIFVLPPREGRAPGATVEKKVRPSSGRYDEWGCMWTSISESGTDMGQVTNIPIDDWDKWESYAMPDPKAEGRFDGLEEALKKAEKKGLYVQLNSPHCIFERMHFLRGFENTLMDCYLEPGMISDMASKLADFQIGIIEEAYRLSRGRIHCYDTTDDWGSQNSLLISPDIFRKIFKPQYKRIVDRCHELGMDVRFHTDGKINDIIPDFIELGIDILNIHQPRLLDIDLVSKIAQGRICFEAAVDIQATMPSGSKALIEAEVRELCDKWGTPQGGLIGVEYGYPEAIDTTRDSMLYALECFQKYGRRR